MVGIVFSSLARAGRRGAFRQITPDSLSRATDYLRVTRATIHRMLKRNQIPTFRIGRH
jgi:hypothetical protein